MISRWLLLIAACFLLVACSKRPPPSHPPPAPSPLTCPDPEPSVGAPQPQTVLRRDGFNELFISAYLYHRGIFEKECPIKEGQPHCPTNAPPIRLDQAATLLDSLAPRSSLTFREIVPLRVIEPTVGRYPYDADLVRALRLYHDRGLSLILAFGGPLPAWVNSDQRYAGVICNFVARLTQVHGFKQSWVLNRLKIEPVTEIGGDTPQGTDRDGLAKIAASRDGSITRCLREKDLYTRVLASSYMAWEPRAFDFQDPSGAELVPVVDYFRRYYRYGGTGAPNVHLYPAHDAQLIPKESGSQALARYRTILGALSTGLPHGLPGGQRFNINVGEIGFYDHVDGDTASAQAHAQLLPTLLSDSAFNATVRNYQVWRILRRWHAYCADGCGQEVSWGFVNAPLPPPQNPPLPWQCVTPTAFEPEQVFSKLYQLGQGQAPLRADVGDWNALRRFERTEFHLAQGSGIQEEGIHLAMQADGNLVLYRDGRPLWSVFSHEGPLAFQPRCSQAEPCSAHFQNDGNLVLYQGRKSYWSSKTNLTGHVLVIHRAPPYLTVLADNGQPVFHGGVKEGDLVGRGWTNSSGFKVVVLNDDDDGTSLQLNANARLVLQPDGNLVLYDAAQRPLWSVFGNESVQFAPNCKNGGCALHFQSDGNLVLYNGSPYWWSGTNGAKRKLRFDDRSRYLFILNERGEVIWSLPGVR